MESFLHEKDFALWTERQAQYIRQKNLEAIDWENIGEEIAALGRSEKHELENRLEVLIEQLLKRCYVNSAYDNRGWELTIKEQRKRIRRLLRSSPSLRTYFDEIFAEIWQDALSDVGDIYPGVNFPDDCPFPKDIDRLISEVFWQR